jgi:hypothetical protein
MGHVVGTEMSLELIPCNRVDVCMGVAVRLPLVCCHSKELARDQKNLLMIRALSDHELPLYSLEPILGFHGILSGSCTLGTKGRRLWLNNLDMTISL